MKKEELIIFVYGNGDIESGGLYNVLGSFHVGLIEGFRNIGVKAYSLIEGHKLGLFPNCTVSVNIGGIDLWDTMLKANVPHIMWTVDSIFTANMPAIQMYEKFSNFTLLSVTQCDTQPIQEYFPSLNYGCLQHATSLELWKKQDVKKDYEITLFSSIYDYEKALQELKEEVPAENFGLIMDMYNIALENPQLPFWDIYQTFREQNLIINLDADQYRFIYHKLCHIIMNLKKIQAVQSLSNFNLKIFGNETWNKYISGKVEYLGPCDVLESIDIMNRSKIVLHPHAITLHYGIHERILNASAVETFVVSSEAPYIKASFGDNMAYYNNATFEDLPDKVDYYLKNDDERIIKAQNARKIVEENHTWDVRAKTLLTLLEQLGTLCNC